MMQKPQWKANFIAIREKYGNNALIKGMNLEEGSTYIERNNQIGGHRA